MTELYNKLEHLENMIIAMNEEKMKRIRLPIPKEYGGGYATGDTMEIAVQNLIKRLEQRKADRSPLFSDYYQEWLNMKAGEGLSAVTIADYEGLANKHLIPFFGKMRICEITPDDIQLYFNEIMHLSKSVSVQSRAILSGIFDKAARNKIIKENPMWYKYKSSKREGEKVVLQDKDLIDIIKDLDKLSVTRDYIYACFLCFTGLRREEILGLRWGDLDFEGHEILVQNAVKFPNGMNNPVIDTPKDHSVGVVKLPNMLARRIEKYQGMADEYILPYNEEHKDFPMTRTMFTKMWKRIKMTVNLKGATSHSFRASYASMIVAHCNADPKTLQKLLRHKTPDLAMRVYAKHNENKIRTTEDAYDDYISRLVDNEDAQTIAQKDA
jgi:integrase